MTTPPRLHHPTYRRERGRWAQGLPPSASPTSHRIAGLLLAGVRPTQITRGLGLRLARVRQVRHWLGLPKEPRTARFNWDTESLIPLVLTLRQSGISYAQIALRVKRWPSSILRSLALRLGPLPKTCARCRRPAAQWHHTSYVPERAQPLCLRCHASAHRHRGKFLSLCSPPSPGATPSRNSPLTHS